MGKKPISQPHDVSARFGEVHKKWFHTSPWGKPFLTSPPPKGKKNGEVVRRFFPPVPFNFAAKHRRGSARLARLNCFYDFSGPWLRPHGTRKRLGPCNAAPAAYPKQRHEQIEIMR